MSQRQSTPARRRADRRGATPARRAEPPSAIEALRADPAVRDGDPDAAAWLITLLERGERAEGGAEQG